MGSTSTRDAQGFHPAVPVSHRRTVSPNADHLKETPTVLVGKTGQLRTQMVSPDVSNLSAAIDSALR